MLVVMITISEGKEAQTTMMASQTRIAATPLEQRIGSDILQSIHAMQEQQMKDGKIASMVVHDPSHILKHE